MDGGPGRAGHVSHMSYASKIVEGRPAGKQSKAVEGPSNLQAGPMEGRAAAKQNMEQQAARLIVEGPQSNAASRVEGRPAGQQVDSAMQQQCKRPV